MLYKATLYKHEGRNTYQRDIFIECDDDTAAYTIAKAMCGPGCKPHVTYYKHPEVDIIMTKKQVIEQYGAMSYNMNKTNGEMVCIYDSRTDGNKRWWT